MKNYVFYVDVYLVQNLLIKFTVLFLTLYVHKQREWIFRWKGIVRVLFVSFLVTVAEILGLLLIPWYGVVVFLVFFVEPFVIMYLIFHKRIMQWLPWILSIYLFTLLVNGVVEVLWNYWGNKIGYGVLLVFACMIAVIGISVWKIEEKRHKGNFEVLLSHCGKQITVQGYYDSGNHLKDPYSKKGVNILAKEIGKALFTEEDAHFLVPYTALGNENGLIEMFYVETMQINGEQEKIYDKVPIGIAEDSLFEGKMYKLILNEEVF